MKQRYLQFLTLRRSLSIWKGLLWVFNLEHVLVSLYWELRTWGIGYHPLYSVYLINWHFFPKFFLPLTLPVITISQSQDILGLLLSQRLLPPIFLLELRSVPLLLPYPTATLLPSLVKIWRLCYLIFFIFSPWIQSTAKLASSLKASK